MDLLIISSLIGLVLSIVAISIAILDYVRQRRSVRIQHLMPKLDRVARVVRDINSASMGAGLLKGNIPELQRKIQPGDPASLFFVNLFALASTFSIKSVFELNQNCDEFLRLLSSLRSEGVLGRIQMMDAQLIWPLHELEDASNTFRRLDVMPLVNAENIVNTQNTLQLLEDIDGNAAKLREVSGECLKRLNKLLY